jgi:hypothetical protein
MVCSAEVLTEALLVEFVAIVPYGMDVETQAVHVGRRACENLDGDHPAEEQRSLWEWCVCRAHKPWNNPLDNLNLSTDKRKLVDSHIYIFSLKTEKIAAWNSKTESGGCLQDMLWS